MPLRENEVDASAPFRPDEQLYRRVLPQEELSDGEIDPTRFNSISFKKEVESAPSVLRGAFATPEDAVHPDCADQKDVSHQFVYSTSVSSLPKLIRSGDGKEFEIFPKHLPLPTCGAHSVVSCCRAGDDTKKYERPSPSARYDLRVKLAANMKKVLPVKG